MAGFYEGAYGSIPGPPGADGADGADGKTVLSGAGAPSAGTGADGDFYINTASLQIYGPKSGGAWGLGTDLAGTDGAPGAAGANATISTVEDEGTPLTARANLNFVGPGVIAADAGGKTVVTIPAGTGGVEIVVDGGGAVPATGICGDVAVPFAGTITKATLIADQAGSLVLDVWKDTYANFPPTVADTITAAAKPTLSAAAKSEDATLTGWTVAVAAGDILRFNIDSIATITRFNLLLTITKG